jgi:hypothetical protein
MTLKEIIVNLAFIKYVVWLTASIKVGEYGTFWMLGWVNAYLVPRDRV